MVRVPPGHVRIRMPALMTSAALIHRLQRQRGQQDAVPATVLLLPARRLLCNRARVRRLAATELRQNRRLDMSVAARVLLAAHR